MRIYVTNVITLIALCVLGMAARSVVMSGIESDSRIRDGHSGIHCTDNASEVVDYGQAARTYAKYREGLQAIPGVNRLGPHAKNDGTYCIKIGFRSDAEREAALADGEVPTQLDGVEVVVDPLSAIVELAS